MLYILFTGSREPSNPEEVEHLVRTHLGPHVAKLGPENVVPVHGSAVGVDSIVQGIVDGWYGMHSDTFPANFFRDPLVRNAFMVKYVSDRKSRGHQVACWAFAEKWASGTGACARYARAANIPTVDWGINTERSAR